MPTPEERAAFADRLKFALARSLKKPVGATALAVQFNCRYWGDRPITPQGAHKWLTGRTIPTEAKLRVLADWLQVDLHWLHYGPSPGMTLPRFHVQQIMLRSTRPRSRQG